MAVVHKIIVVITFVRTVYALSCTSCDKTACDEPINCKAGLVKGLCGCCDVCAKLKNQRCGGPWYIHGKCAKGLKCVMRTQLENLDGYRFLPVNFKGGVCEPDACQNITCGFRQKCKINKRGKPVCICPRKCGKAKYPVCGLLNGKQYRNKCKLQRQECLTKTEIGFTTGDCKKCTYKRKEFKFGEARPDAKPCENCICNHGSWKCDIRPNCFLNNLPIRSDHLSCLVSQNGESHVLPCPRGFVCRFPPSEDIHDSFRVGICKPKKVKKPRTVAPFIEIHLKSNKIIKERIVDSRLFKSTLPVGSEYKRTTVFTELRTTAATTNLPTFTSTAHIQKHQEQNGGLMKHVCLTYPDQRSCSVQTTRRWFYNATIRSCVQFDYGGCGGNFNNFLSEKKCQEVCHSDSHPTAWHSPPTQPSPIYVTQFIDEHDESTVLLDMCHDMKTGMSYRNREKWHVDACTSCSCVSGRALCVAATCPLTCWNAVHVEGKCCPVCDLDEDVASQGDGTMCEDSEKDLWYFSGESWNKDNCTKCVCFEGEISCMTSVCSKPLCPDPITKAGVCCPACSEEYEQVSEPTKRNGNVECKVLSTGKIYLPGEGWNIDDCVSCFCNSDGQQMCYETRCPTSKCRNPVHLQGRCCPVCPEVFHSACIYDNRQYFKGDFMLLKDMCTLCKCNGNMWNCSKKYCNTTVKDKLLSPHVNLKPTTPYNTKYDRAPNRRFYVNTRMMENIATDFDTEKPENYIVEDPSRMTGRNMKESFIIPTKTAKFIEYGKISRHKWLTNTHNHNSTTAPTTRKERPSQANSEHNNTYSYKGSKNTEEASLISKPSEKTVEEDTLPWSKDFNPKFWSNWDEPEYNDQLPDSQDVFGMKKL